MAWSFLFTNPQHCHFLGLTVFPEGEFVVSVRLGAKAESGGSEEVVTD